MLKFSHVLKLKYSPNCLLTIVCLTAIAKHRAKPSHPQLSALWLDTLPDSQHKRAVFNWKWKERRSSKVDTIEILQDCRVQCSAYLHDNARRGQYVGMSYVIKHFRGKMSNENHSSIQELYLTCHWHTDLLFKRFHLNCYTVMDG